MYISAYTQMLTYTQMVMFVHTGMYIQTQIDQNKEYTLSPGPHNTESPLNPWKEAQNVPTPTSTPKSTGFCQKAGPWSIKKNKQKQTNKNPVTSQCISRDKRLGQTCIELLVPLEQQIYYFKLKLIN